MIFNNFADKRALVIVPHPDDDLLGTGGLLVKYGRNIDTICVSSSGIPSVDGKFTAVERNEMRINEWNKVMTRVNINKTYINSTFGDNFPFIDKLNSDIKLLLERITLSEYDYIFVPGFLENHVEHRWITYTFLPKLLKKKHKRELNIVLYEVWALLPKVTDYLDISNEMEEILDIFQIYVSQLMYVDYDKRLEGLKRYRGLMANRAKYAEAYMTMSVGEYKLLKSILKFGLDINGIRRKLRNYNNE